MAVATPGLILLPPSEGKAAGGDGPPWSPGTMAVDLDPERHRVQRSLRGAMRANASARAGLLGVKGEALAAATAVNRLTESSPTMPAIERYTGVLYDELDAGSLTAAARRRLEAQVLIFSGLWGVLAPEDPIPDYKLKMGASLGRLGRLATWWRPAIDAALDARLGRAGVVWNLLPNEHDAAWTAPTGVTVCTVRFAERRADGALSTVSHWNKLLKGALVRHLVGDEVAAPADLADWHHPLGYRFERAASELGGDRPALTFVREG